MVQIDLILCTTVTNVAKDILCAQHTNDTPYLALMNNLWSVMVNIAEKWPLQWDQIVGMIKTHKQALVKVLCI